jgi:Ca2+-binding RTX toxin-like protein
MADIVGSEAAETLTGTSGDDTITAFGGNDRIFANQAGLESINAGDGNDGIYFGRWFTRDDQIDGGAGIDTLAIRGIYDAQYYFTPTTLTNVEVLLLASKQNTTWGDIDDPSFGHAYYHIVVRPEMLNSGRTLTIISGSPAEGVPGLQEDEPFKLFGWWVREGQFRVYAGLGQDELIGGSGNDGFFFETGGYTKYDIISGEGGTDTVALRGDYDGAADDGADYALDLGNFGAPAVEVLALLSSHTNQFGGAIRPEGFDYDIIWGPATNGLDVNAAGLLADETVRFDGRPTEWGNFRIFSGASDDVLYGGGGADMIHGALGADTIDGSDGADTYVYRSIAESTAASRDTVTLGDGDRIDLTYIDAIAGTPGNDGFTFVGAAAFSGTAGELRAAQAGDGWIVEGDVDGDGVGDLMIAVISADPIVVADFLL